MKAKLMELKMQVQFTEAKLSSVYYEKKAISFKIDRCKLRYALACATYPADGEFQHHQQNQDQEKREQESQAAANAADRAAEQN